MIFFGSFLFLFYILRLWLAGFGGIHPDEAYYVSWAADLQGGYFDHPPLIAWMIRAGQELAGLVIPSKVIQEYPVFFSQTAFRSVPYLVSAVGVPLVIGRCIEITQARPLGLLQMIAIFTSPLFLFGPQVVTPDLPFFFFWALTLYFNLRIVEGRGPDAVPGDETPFRTKYAVGAGLALAAAGYSKHAAVLAAGIFLVSGVGPANGAVAALVGAIAIIPHLLWYKDVGIPGQAGVLFQFRNALGDPFAPLAYRRMGDLIASQILLWSPAVFLGVFSFVIADLKRFFLPRRFRKPTGVLFLWAVIPLVFFSLTALKRPAEANWPLVGAIAGTVLFISRSFDVRRRLVLMILSNLLVTVVGHIALFHPLLLAGWLKPTLPHLARQLEKPSRTREFTDWDRFHTLVFETTRSNDFPVLAQSYQTLSGLLYFDSVVPAEERMGPRLKIWAEGSRRSQFNLQPERLLDPVVKSYWLVTNPGTTPPPECHVTQSLYKNLGDDTPYAISRCNF